MLGDFVAFAVIFTWDGFIIFSALKRLGRSLGIFTKIIAPLERVGSLRILMLSIIGGFLYGEILIAYSINNGSNSGKVSCFLSVCFTALFFSLVLFIIFSSSFCSKS